MLEPSDVRELLLGGSDVRKHFGRRHVVKAVDGVDIEVFAGRSVGIAGESGSGKSTVLKLLLDLQRPTSGTLTYRDHDLETLTRSERRDYRAGVQAVFQDPGGSFNPRHRIGSVVTEPAWRTRGVKGAERAELARAVLASVDLPIEFADRFPHELSGGQRQRVAIARALSSDPKVVLLDEPVTALDISIRGAVINLLNRTAENLDTTFVVVSHDLTAIYHLTDYLYVMRKGLVVEQGPTVDVIATPAHQYTQRLVAAIGDPLSGYRNEGQRPEDDDHETTDEPELPLAEVGPDRRARVRSAMEPTNSDCSAART